MNILIVDDEELIRNVIKEYAINEGYHTLEASDGEKAIEMVKNNNIILGGEVTGNVAFQGEPCVTETGLKCDTCQMHPSAQVGEREF